MKLNRAVFVVICASIILFLSCRACVAQANEKRARHPGSELQIEKAVARADVIAIGVLTELGFTNPTAPGQAAYDNSIFKIKKILKGTCGDTVSVRVRVMYYGNIHELTPKPGSEYILFLAPDEDKQTLALKILPNNAETLGEVTAAITAKH